MGTTRACRNRGPHQRRPRPDPAGGFTLVEVMVAVVVVGIGISAALYGMGSSLVSADGGRDVLVSGILADYVYQFSEELAFWDPENGGGPMGPESGEEDLDDYDDIDDLQGLILSPPIGADGQSLTSFPGWSQSIMVQTIDPFLFVALVDPEASPVRRVRVEIMKGERTVGRYEWLVTRL